MLRALCTRPALALCRSALLPVRRAPFAGRGLPPTVQARLKSTQHELPPLEKNRCDHANLVRFVEYYKRAAHYEADLNPLQPRTSPGPVNPRLHPGQYCLTDETAKFPLDGIVHIPGKTEATLKEIVEHLNESYRKNIGADFSVCTDEEQEWLSKQLEAVPSRKRAIARETKQHILKTLAESEAFDDYLFRKEPTFKRYSLEGLESMLVLVDALFGAAHRSGTTDVVIGMAHRGRLNLLTNLLKLPGRLILYKLKGFCEIPPGVQGTADVMSHLAKSVDLQYAEAAAHPLHVTLLHNPSHLEAVNPVVLGKAKAKHAGRPPGDQSVLPLVIHGDAACAGQGVVAETLQLSLLPPFNAGVGTVNIITNNQIGFTTMGGRSCTYAGDVAKAILAPLIVVNGEAPEEVALVADIAVEFVKRFNKDVFVDLIGYRRWGHNEVDEPSFTQPTMYKNIRARDSIAKVYARQLASQNDVEEQTLAQHLADYSAMMDGEMASLPTFVPEADHLKGKWESIIQDTSASQFFDTGYSLSALQEIARKSVTTPEGFSVHSRLVRSFVQPRLAKADNLEPVDWATAECLAMGSLLQEGYTVRLCGQDVNRGTFSHRHFSFICQDTDKRYVPLEDPEKPWTLQVVNSPLSEMAVMAFEYGFSIEDPNNMVLWEAQFGDFFNGAQIIIDTFIASGEAKWLRQTGMVLLLPHGMDGAGPEHSSSHVERFLQLCDGDMLQETDANFNTNMHVVNPTTPSQYFHVLRRQMRRPYRKPLVVISPKTLLRHPLAVSPWENMAPGSYFWPVIGDDSVDPGSVKTVVFCSGKVYYDLEHERSKRKLNEEVAIVRVEELSPFPAPILRQELARYVNATSFVWCQEEHQNQGAWSYVMPRFEYLVGLRLRYAGRGPSPVVATGNPQVHRQEAIKIMEDCFQ